MKTLKSWCEENGREDILKSYLLGDNPKDADLIGFSSGKHVRWKCEHCGQVWMDSPNKMNRRVHLFPICPFCRGEKVGLYNNIAVRYPVLKEYWDYEANDKNLYEYSKGSHDRVNWSCPQNHSWTAVIKDQIRFLKNNPGSEFCPLCRKEKVSNSYNLEVCYPDIAMEWDYAKNTPLTPREVLPHSNTKVWWRCKFNPKHSWQEYISNRTTLHRGCPECSKRLHISYAAKALYYYLFMSNIDCQCEKRVGKYTIDILVRTHKWNIAIEVDGRYAHSNEEALRREKRKNEYLLKKGYQIIRIKEDSDVDSITDDALSDDTLPEINIIRYRESSNYNTIDEMIMYVLQKLKRLNIIRSVLWGKINHKNDYYKIQQLYYHECKRKTMAIQYPKVSKELVCENGETADMIFPGLIDKRKWKCPVCSNVYTARISNRTLHGSKCPECRKKKHSV